MTFRCGIASVIYKNFSEFLLSQSQILFGKSSDIAYGNRAFYLSSLK